MDQVGPRIESGQIKLVVLEADMATIASECTHDCVDYTKFEAFLSANGLDKVDAINDCEAQRYEAPEGPMQNIYSAGLKIKSVAHWCNNQINHYVYRKADGTVPLAPAPAPTATTPAVTSPTTPAADVADPASAAGPLVTATAPAPAPTTADNPAPVPAQAVAVESTKPTAPMVITAASTATQPTVDLPTSTTTTDTPIAAADTIEATKRADNSDTAATKVPPPTKAQDIDDVTSKSSLAATAVPSKLATSLSQPTSSASSATGTLSPLSPLSMLPKLDPLKPALYTPAKPKVTPSHAKPLTAPPVISIKQPAKAPSKTIPTLKAPQSL